MKNTEYILYLDMDGVLVDFQNGFRGITKGMTPDEMKLKFGDKTVREYYLNAGSEFWADLDWVEGGKELWKASSLLFERVCILSSMGTTDPKRGKEVEEGKRQWIKKNIPSLDQSNVFIVAGKHIKKKYASKNSILVDDMPITVREWNISGGFGILHHHLEYKKTIEDLEDIARPISLTEMAKRIRKRYL